ncbi:MAG: hypothetical protein J7K53_13650 [Bacteroidales bacterium]|nr:hypothetical protein [Bacteroidales bacterium]
MKKSLILFIIILIVILFFPVLNIVKWGVQPKRPLDVLILDKTVPTYDRYNHKSFHWILTHNKYVKGNKRLYSYKKDYFGFVPLRPLRDKQWEPRRIRFAQIIELADSLDALYYADTYGVYFNDWYHGINRSNRSRLIYGGLNNSDYSLLKEMKDRDKLVIAEYNILAYPTAPLERNKTENIFDIHWTGWAGKYYKDLNPATNPEIPKWIIKLYEKDNLETWPFINSGIILVKNDNKVIVLENETHLDFDVPFIYSSKEAQEAYDLPYKVNYPHWFNIIESGENIVLSEFKIHANYVGDSLLEANLIPEVFPAVIMQPEKKHYFYFAGDFANNVVNYSTTYFKDIEKVDKYLYNNDLSDKRKFYWKYYKPLVTNILNDYYLELKEK